MVRKIKSNWKKFTIILLGCIVLLVVVCYCAKIIRRATYNVWTYDIDNFLIGDILSIDLKCSSNHTARIQQIKIKGDIV
jgi:hypothetical protein